LLQESDYFHLRLGLQKFSEETKQENERLGVNIFTWAFKIPLR
jgi:hypothetical protein